ncbi:UNVERIFIED_CONTAM: hypothetical protein ABID98_002488 [Brevibacillus sp. OAP136]
MIVAGWCVVTSCYFVSLFLASWLYTSVTGWPTDVHRDVSGLVLGIVMVVAPYVIGGIYVRKTVRSRKSKAALWISLVPAVMEKVLVLLIGSWFVILGGSPVTLTNILMFVSAEAIPYFTVPYLLTFPLSVFVTLATAKAIGGGNRAVIGE